jgi:tetratricopeptide (TPR) repeat protein
VAGPLWFAVALALASLPIAPRVFPRAPLPSLFLPIPALGAVALAYVVLCFYPVSSSLSLMRTAERHATVFQTNRILFPAYCARTVGLFAGLDQQATVLTTAIELGVRVPQIRTWADEAPRLMDFAVLGPLREAKDDDPDNSRVWIQIGRWYVEAWEFLHVFSERDPARARRLRDQQLEVVQLARSALLRAAELDPNGLLPLQAEVELSLTLARYHNYEAESARRAKEAVKDDPKLKTAEERETRRKEIEAKEKQSRANADEYLRNAAGVLRKAVNLDPTEAPLHYQLAEMLNRVGDTEACREEARRALHLDEVSTLPPRKLTDPQRTQAKSWAEAGSGG